MSRMKTVGAGMEAITQFKGIATPESAAPPETPSLDGNRERLLEKARQIKERAKTYRNWTLNVLSYLEPLRENDRTLLEVMEEDDPGAIEKNDKELQRILWKETSKPVRRAAWLSLFEYWFKREVQSEKEALDLLNSLVRDHYLLPANESRNGIGPISAFVCPFFISPQSSFEQEEVDEVQAWLRKMEQAAQKRQNEAYRQAVDKLPGNRSFTSTEFLKGTPGLYLFHIPGAPKLDRNGISTGSWWAGGKLVVDVNHTKSDPYITIYAVEGRPNFVIPVEDAQKEEVELALSSLQEEEAPLFPNLGPTRGGKTKLLWYLLKRGLKHLKEEEEILASQEILRAEANISPSQFFQGKDGTCLIEFQGSWYLQNGETKMTIHHMFFLAERSGSFIRIQLPKHLEEILSPCLNLEFRDTDGQFRGTDLLGPVFRAVKNATAQKKD